MILLHIVIETDSSYVFTRGIDREDITLFCYQGDQSLELVWKIQGGSTNVQNPLSISTVLDEDVDNQRYQCYNITVGNHRVLNADIQIQG